MLRLARIGATAPLRTRARIDPHNPAAQERPFAAFWRAGEICRIGGEGPRTARADGPADYSPALSGLFGNFSSKKGRQASERCRYRIAISAGPSPEAFSYMFRRPKAPCITQKDWTAPTKTLIQQGTGADSLFM